MKKETTKILTEAFGLKDWAEAEAAYSKRNVQPVPEGWQTVKMYAESCNPKMVTTSAANKLKQMYEAGFLDREEWRGPTCNRCVLIYRPKKK